MMYLLGKSKYFQMKSLSMYMQMRSLTTTKINLNLSLTLSYKMCVSEPHTNFANVWKSDHSSSYNKQKKYFHA